MGRMGIIREGGVRILKDILWRKNGRKIDVNRRFNRGILRWISKLCNVEGGMMNNVFFCLVAFWMSASGPKVTIFNNKSSACDYQANRNKVYIFQLGFIPWNIWESQEKRLGNWDQSFVEKIKCKRIQEKKKEVTEKAYWEITVE